ncbi:MAG: ComEC/Rec2 family competence protein, partial [Sulfurimonas sp.]
MIERVELFRNKKDLLTLFSLFILLCSLSLAYEYYNYKQLTKFDSALVEAKVLKQYTKTKLKTNGKTKTYQVLLLEADQGFKFYTIAKKDFPNVKDRSVQLEIFLKSLNFYEYMNRFFAFSKIEKVYKHKQNLKQALQQKIAQQHSDTNISALYQALYLASDLPYELRKELSNLGVSHLIAISGFHLG